MEGWLHNQFAVNTNQIMYFELLEKCSKFVRYFDENGEPILTDVFSLFEHEIYYEIPSNLCEFVQKIAKIIERA